MTGVEKEAANIAKELDKFTPRELKVNVSNLLVDFFLEQLITTVIFAQTVQDTELVTQDIVVEVVAHSVEAVRRPRLLEGLECLRVVPFLRKDESQIVVEATVVDEAGPFYSITLLYPLQEVLLCQNYIAVLKEDFGSGQVRFVVG